LGGLVKEPDNLSDTDGTCPLSADLPPTFAHRTRKDGAPLSWGGAGRPQNNSNSGGQECPPYTGSARLREERERLGQSSRKAGL